jgi:hypothetical protein
MRFSIRDLLWFTAVVALAVGLWVERVKTAALAERIYELEQSYLGLKPGGYELVPIGLPADPTVKRFVDIEVTQSTPDSSAPAPNPPKP